MIITSKNEGMTLWDGGIAHLEELLSSIDALTSNVTDEAKLGELTDTDCDRGEYFIGVGFCAMQRYLFDVLEDVNIKPHLARQLGPKSSKGRPIAELIHSAANYWKHSPEWHVWLDSLGKRSQDTLDILLHERNSADYPLSDLLADLCIEDTLSLINCLPHLLDWRLAVYEHVKMYENL